MIQTGVAILSLLTCVASHLRGPHWGTVVYQRPIDAMVDVTNELAVAVLQDHAYTRSNYAFSPYGVASVLVVLYEGARGESARQIHNTLRLPWNRDVTRIGFRDIHRNLKTYFTHEGYLSGLTLNKKNTSLLPEFRQVLRFYGYDVGLMMPEESPTPSPETVTTAVPTEETAETTTIDTTVEIIDVTESSETSQTPPEPTVTSEPVVSTEQETATASETHATTTPDSDAEKTTTTEFQTLGVSSDVPQTSVDTTSDSSTTKESETSDVILTSDLTTTETQTQRFTETATEETHNNIETTISLEPSTSPLTSMIGTITESSFVNPETSEPPNHEISSGEETQNPTTQIAVSTTSNEDSSKFTTEEEESSQTEKETTPQITTAEENEETSTETATTTKISTQQTSANTELEGFTVFQLEIPLTSETPREGDRNITSENKEVDQLMNIPEPRENDSEYNTTSDSLLSASVVDGSAKAILRRTTREQHEDATTESDSYEETTPLFAILSGTNTPLERMQARTETELLTTENRDTTKDNSAITVLSDTERFDDNVASFEGTVQSITEPEYKLESSKNFSEMNMFSTDATVTESNSLPNNDKSGSGEIIVQNNAFSDVMETLSPTFQPTSDNLPIYESTFAVSTATSVNAGTAATMTEEFQSFTDTTTGATENINRTRRALKNSQDLLWPEISLQLQNGMFDSEVARGNELYATLPKYPFLVDGVSEELVPVMAYTNTFPFAYIPRLHALALEFPLDDDRYKLLLLLPVERRGLRQLIYDLGSYPLRDVHQSLRPTRVSAVIPSFMVEGFVILTPTLQQLGIWDVFDPRRADLSGMSEDPDLYVRNIEQAVTVVIRNYVRILDIQTRTMAARTETERFQAVHPFLYFVMDRDTHVALMAGKIVDPLNSRVY